MSFKNANWSKFLFVSDALDPEKIYVREFTGHEEISGLYTFDILLEVHIDNIVIEDVINRKATLYLYRENEFCSYSGFIATFEFVRSTVDYLMYRVILRPNFWKLTLTKQCRIFQKVTIPEIIKEVLNTSGINGPYRINVSSGTYPEQEYVVQYNESDFNFILRLMDKTGMWYFFEEPVTSADSLPAVTNEEKLIITDSASDFSDISATNIIKFRTLSGMVKEINNEESDIVYELEMCRNSIPEKVAVKNYNYRTPDIDLEFEKDVPDADLGTIYEYGGNYQNSVFFLIRPILNRRSRCLTSIH